MQDATTLSLITEAEGISANIDQTGYKSTSDISGIVSIRSGKCTLTVAVDYVDSIAEGRNPVSIPAVNEESAQVKCLK